MTAATPNWPVTLAVAQAPGAAVATTAAKTTLLPAHAKFLCPTTGFWYPGKVLRVKAVGTIGTFTSGTLTLALDVGTIDVFASQALTMVASQTNQTWWLDLLFTLQALGLGGSATANGIGVGTLQAGSAITAAATQLPNTGGGAVGTSFDPDLTTNTIDLMATWSVSNAANTIQLKQYTLEALN
jgi:hypothetical protein